MSTRILLIDDHDSLRRNVAAMLSDEGLEVTEAISGENALEILATQSFDLAIVDMRLPGMSGDDFMEIAAPIYPALRFLVHTGSVDYVLSPTFRALGLSDADIFFKPISDLDRFFDRIRALCPESQP